MSSNQQSSDSTWNTHLKWIGSKINKFWKNPQPQKLQSSETSHINNKKCLNKKMESQGNNQYNFMDPKTRVLNRIRGNNLGQNLQEKIKKVNKYFSKKQSDGEKPCDLVCPICLQLFIKPVTTMCGHSFCIKCLDQTLLFKSDCPSCRNYLRGSKIIQCQSLNKLILRTIQKYDKYELQAYNQLFQQTMQWINKRTLDYQSIQIGDMIDVKDTQFIWCKAIVKQKYRKKNITHGLLVHYIGWNSIYDEIIQTNSQRLASPGFYTQRKQIPHYKLSQNEYEQRMYSYVVNSESQVSNMQNMMSMNMNMNINIGSMDQIFDQPLPLYNSMDFEIGFYENINFINSFQQHQSMNQHNLHELPLDYDYRVEQQLQRIQEHEHEFEQEQYEENAVDVYNHIISHDPNTYSLEANNASQASYQHQQEEQQYNINYNSETHAIDRGSFNSNSLSLYASELEFQNEIMQAYYAQQYRQRQQGQPDAGRQSRAIEHQEDECTEMKKQGQLKQMDEQQGNRDKNGTRSDLQKLQQLQLQLEQYNVNLHKLLCELPKKVNEYQQLCANYDKQCEDLLINSYNEIRNPEDKGSAYNGALMEKLERFDRKLIELEEDKEKCNNNNTAVKVNFKEAENSSIIKQEQKQQEVHQNTQQYNGEYLI